MSPLQLLEWMKHPGVLDNNSLDHLHSLLDDYPCFVTARMLYLKNLFLQKDLRYSTELVRTAVSVPDRKRLFQFIEDRPDESIEALETRTGQSYSSGFSIIDRFLHSSTSSHEKGSDTNDQDSRERACMDEIVNDYGLESFTLDYLSYQTLHPKKANDTKGTDEPPKTDGIHIPMQGHNLIEAFLLNDEPQFRSKTADSSSESDVLTTDSMTDDADASAELWSDVDFKPIQEASFTETLARIYLKQKRYDRALEIIKTLSLKYPEKNVYFADQIRYLEKLIIHTKNN